MTKRKTAPKSIVETERAKADRFEFGAFPKALYRDGKDGIETRVVEKPSALKEAKQDGWLENDEYLKGR